MLKSSNICSQPPCKTTRNSKHGIENRKSASSPVTELSEKEFGNVGEVTNFGWPAGLSTRSSSVDCRAVSSSHRIGLSGDALPYLQQFRIPVQQLPSAPRQASSKDSPPSSLWNGQNVVYWSHNWHWKTYRCNFDPKNNEPRTPCGDEAN